MTGEPWSFTNWGAGEPNNSGSDPTEDGLMFNGQPGWNDASRTVPGYGYIIEYDLVPEPSSLLALGTGILALAGMIRRERHG